jgi:hypothetical protein
MVGLLSFYDKPLLEGRETLTAESERPGKHQKNVSSEGGYTMGDPEPLQERLPRGFLIDNVAALWEPPQVAFAGHVRLVEGVVLTTFVGCFAVVVLSDPPGKEISVVTSEQRLQSLLETALATGNLMHCYGHQIFHVPWAENTAVQNDLYRINIVTLYNQP